MPGSGPRRDPVRLLLSGTLWAGAWYLLAYQVVGWVLFAVALTIVVGGYRVFTGSGLLARLRAQWTDPQLWWDVAYLSGLFVPLLTLDFAVLVIWLTFLTLITLPAWYWAPWQTVHGVRYHGWQLGYFPNGPHGHPGYGLYVDTLPKALLAAAVSLVLFLLFNYVLVATARAHAATARALLRAPDDPLREAKEVLQRPGPLNSTLR
jgi:hypothetical protein